MSPPDTFTFWGAELEYCRESYNHSGENERSVEIPIAQWFIGQQGPERTGLEIGNVLSHYGRPDHIVVDRYEAGAHLMMDLFNYHQSADWIVSISTLEHVWWDEPGKGRHPDGPARALEHLYSLLAPGGRMLVSTPFGWHPFWDSVILDERLPVKPERQCTMTRVGGDPVQWVQQQGLFHQRYAASTIWAEAVWVAEFRA